MSGYPADWRVGFGPAGKGTSVGSGARRGRRIGTAQANGAAANPVQPAQGLDARMMPGDAPALPAHASPSTGLGPDVQAHIGRQLRTAYQRIVDEPVPERFVALLEGLAAKDKT
jgi:Anti-sigma factor NepR